MELFGVRILGFNDEGLRKVVLTLVVLGLAFAARSVFRVVIGFGIGTTSKRTLWVNKGIRLAIGFAASLLLLSIWFDDPGSLASFMGLLAAGMAFAAQNLVLSVAGYFVIVFGKIFDLGHRIELGGVRGDVLDIGLVKTTIMESGRPAVAPETHQRIAARQYTGRVVSVVNAEVFRQPVFNYTSNFDLLWEEIRLPLPYDADLAVAERILAKAARTNTREEVEMAGDQFDKMRRLYLIQPADLEPQVFIQLAADRIELSVRFLVSTYGTRVVKDKISREIVAEFQKANIELAAPTIEVVGVPEVSVRAKTS